MKSDLVHNARVFGALMHRDLYELKGRLVNACINGLISISLQAFIFGYLFPMMSVPLSRALAMLVGQFISSIINFCFLRGIRLVFDLKFTRFIDYHVTLPLPKQWLIAQYILSFCLEVFAITLPMVATALVLIYPLLIGAKSNLLGFIAMYLLTILFFSVFIILLSFALEFQRFLMSIWPRILRPLFLFSSAYFSWGIIHTAYPILSWLFLISPITYCAEGLRASIFGGGGHLPIMLCIAVTCGWIAVMTTLLYWLLNKRLDLV